MDNISIVEKKFLKFLLNYKRNSITVSLCEVLLNFFKVEYEGYEICFAIKIGEVDFFSENKKLNNETLNKFKDDLFSILFLISKFVKSEQIIPYELNDVMKIGKENSDSLFSIKFPIDNVLYDSLRSNYIIDSSLKDFVQNKFRTSETLKHDSNFKVAIFSIGVGILVNALIYLKDISKNIITIFNLILKFIPLTNVFNILKENCREIYMIVLLMVLVSICRKL